MPGLPDYDKPPVIEVAIGIQFAPITELSAAHVGLYWGTIRDTFNRAKEQAPIAHIVEPPVGPPEPQLAFQIFDKPELPRMWFIDTSGNRIIQVQRDRFLHNWRKTGSTDEYPRFPSVKESFFLHWRSFTNFLAEQGLQPQPDQCELTYVNHVKKGDGWDTMADLSTIFTTFAWRTRSDFLPIPDNARWSLRFLLPDKMGRLHVDVVPVRVQPNNDLAIRFSLTVRGKPSNIEDTASLSQWYDLAREWIVKGFADLIDEKTDALWEKKA
ncbi:MAG: TIGR04255 family protein [Phycisphaerae bacterium]|nr:TIGR04255 family protein [Phycisphaerae bacterium]